MGTRRATLGPLNNDIMSGVPRDGGILPIAPKVRFIYNLDWPDDIERKADRDQKPTDENRVAVSWDVVTAELPLTG